MANRRFVYALKVVGAVVLMAVISGAAYEQVGRRRDRALLPQVGRSVDIGGRSLNLYCSGEGSPTVIFDSGNGAPGYVWADIQPEVARITRACWYDRAGEGWSDPGPPPRTSGAMAQDLHELLHRANVPTPYVLVGHSMGGLNARVYNGIYPADVAGAVLLDAAHEDEAVRAPSFMLAPTVSPRWWAPIWIAGQTARAIGIIRLTSPRVELPQDSAARSRRRVVRALRSQSAAVANQFDASDPESYAQAARAGGFGDKPLLVLTRGKVNMPAHPSAEDKEFAAYEQVWKNEIQPKLARLSTRGRQIIVENSGHGIPDEAPEVVIAAVKEMVDEVRKTPPAPIAIHGKQ